MNKYHFLLVLERQQRRGKPHGEWCLIALSMFLGLLPSMLSADFRDAYGLDGAAWKAIIVILAIVTGLAMLILSVWWTIRKKTRPDKTPEETLAAVIDEMERDRERALRPVAASDSLQASETAGHSPVVT